MNIEVQITEDYMSAYILVRLEEGETVSRLTEKELYTALDNKGVNTGIGSNAIKQIISSQIYNQSVCIANGIPPKVGEDARVEIIKKPKKKQDIIALTMSDGKVDYYSPREGFLVYARKDEVLVVKYPPTRGEPGKNVLGRMIPGRLGKEISLDLFSGKNTTITDDKIVAETDGIIKLEGLQISVLNEYEIKDNVGKNTGSIDLPLDLNCKLVIKGDIQRGYKTSCSDLFVSGCVEDADVTVKNLTVKEGIVGIGEKKVIAENINVGYINGLREVYANTIFVLREISNGAKIYSNVVKAYAIQGSTVIARDAIWAEYVNGKNYITVGIDYRVKLKYDELSNKILAMENPMNELKELDLLNTKKMKKLVELARVNPKHPLLQQELPKIREAKEKLDNFLNIRIELIKKREEIAQKIYSKSEPFFFVRSKFSRDNSTDYIVEPNTTLILRESSMRITEIMEGGLFTINPHGIAHSFRYNIKEIKNQFDKYVEASE
jgi:uncharacterized protein (DUF342 family)